MMTLGDFRKCTAALPDDMPLFSGALDYYYRHTKHNDAKRKETEPSLDGYLKLADSILHRSSRPQ